MLSAAILSIGDELLIGQVVNTNASYLSQQLNAIGVDVTSVVTVGDDAAQLRRAIDRAWKEHDIVIATGGLGPTHDDISKHIVAKYFKKQLHLDKPTLRRVKARFAAYGYKRMPEANIGQAMVPDDFEALANARGTAPGLWYHTKGKTFVILPGVPHEMKHLTETQLIRRFKRIYAKKLGAVILHRTLLTTGIGESALAEKVGNVKDFLEAGATLAFLPKTSGVRLRISVRHESERTANAIIARIEKKIRERVGNAIFGTEEQTLEEAVVALLRAKKKTLAIAESCTGGMLSMRVTNVSGSSKVFEGGVISYSNDVKMRELGVPAAIIKKYGAVSEETARAMAEGARKKFGTDYTLAITGIAGPDGGTKEKPVGTVYIALASKKETLVKLAHFGGERQIVRERSADAALEMLRQQLI